MSSVHFCGQCGTANSDQATFCTNCGASLHSITTAQIETPASVVAPASPSHGSTQTRASSSGKIIIAVSIAVAILTGTVLWSQLTGKQSLDAVPATTVPLEVVTTTSSTTSTTSTSTTTTTTTSTTLAPAPFGFAARAFWIDDVPMALPPCDGSYITIIASTSGSRAASGSQNYANGQYLRTDLTCPSLNPFFSSGALQGQPIYLIFFGPYYNRYDAQQKCLDLGIRRKANCYVAPLTSNSSDRSVRFGPLDS